MYLKKLELYGFKTFADKTEIEFTPGITCIVGPNGSGKSNIADAIRWVLGEQSVKTLRFSSLEEVIFAGSEKRKPLNIAQINLIIDNSGGRLPIDYTEIGILRRTFRSGESEYFINKVPSLLRDIQELFFDTGLGKNTYSLVNQGQVDLVLHSKPEERRLILEEAAGVSKFKHKKKEALRKLENTRLNLLRLQDIVSEINNQLLPLKEQAERAKKYQEINNKLQILEINLKGSQLIQNKEKLSKLKEEEELIKQRQEEKRKSIDLINNSRHLKEKEKKKLEDILSEYQMTSQGFVEMLEEKRTQIAVNREKINSLGEQIQIRLDVIQDLENKLKDLDIEKENKVNELEKIENILGEKEKILEDNEKNLQYLEEEIKKKTDDLELKKSEIIEVIREITKNNNEIFYFKNIIQEKEKIIRKLKEEIKIGEIKSEKNNIEIEETTAKIKEERKKVEDLIIQLGELKQKEKNKIEEKTRIEKEIEEWKLKLASSRNLSQLLEEFPKYQPVKTILEEKERNPEKFPGLLGKASHLFKIDSNLADAVKVALGEYFHYLVIENSSQINNIINYINENNLNKVGIISLDLIPTETEITEGEGEEKIIDKIEYTEKLENLFKFLLGDIFLIKNFNLENLNKLPSNIRAISYDGKLFYSKGILVAGSKTSSEFSEYQEDISSVLEDIQKAELKIEKLTEEKEKVEREIKEILEKEEIKENENKEREILLANLEKGLTFLSKNKEEINEEISIRKRELVEDEKEIIELKEKKDRFKNTIEDLNEVKNNLENILSQEQKIYISEINKKEELANSNTVLKIEIASLKEKKDNFKNMIENYDGEIGKLKKQIISKVEENKNSQEVINDLKKFLDEEVTNLEKLNDERKIKKEEVESTRERIKLIEEETAKEGEIIEGLNIEYSSTNEELHSLQINIAQIQTETQEVANRLSEEYNLTPEEIISRCERVEDEEKSLKEMKKLRNIISCLGPINPLAIEEYDRQKERFDFLNQQKSDLEEAREALLKFIKEMDSKTKKALLKTFQEIQLNFDLIFKQLFEGGEAKLILLDESNILETGIDIEVRLPGKRSQNISLLSGGEKTLVAIALLFAILRVKPSPFCILDEIDAALDEVNIEKFKKLLSEFSKDIQFIIITHNKGTMETANTLYGVTMEEEGISKLVSVKLQDVGNDG